MRTVFVLLAILSVQQLLAEKPNIVFVLADDLGWAELGCYGNDFNETPHLDRLAGEGMRFTEAYAAAPVCSPYRAALLTGQWPARVGILDYLRPDSDTPLSADHHTIAEALGDAGYATGHIGKWHLTGYKYHEAPIELRPKDHGFDWQTGFEIKGVGNGANFWPYVFRTQPISWLSLPENRLGEDEYLTDRLNLEAVEFIERNRDQPFFLYLAHYAPHTILNGRPDLVQKYREKYPPGPSDRENCYLCQDAGRDKSEGCVLHHWSKSHNPHLGAMLESIDDGIGLISAKLEELGLAENTILIFSSDNGGELNVTSNSPLRGGKSQLYEGGVRVPLIVRWPDRVKPESVCEAPTVNVDFYPTFLEATGAESNQPLDGISIAPLFGDPAAELPDRPIFWHYPLEKPHFLGGVSAGAIRDGNWKLIEFFDTSEVELYDLKADRGETKNLAESQPERVQQLLAKLRIWRRQFGE